MKKIIITLLILLISVFIASANVSGNTSNAITNNYSINNLPVIFVTSDNFISESTDKEMLNNIKKAIGDSANVIIDKSSPNPGEAPRAVKNAPGGTAAYIAAADPGSMVDLVTGIKTGYLKSDAQKLVAIVFVNYGATDLENTRYLPRSYDDNYSNPYFAGLYSPSLFLKDAGIDLIQPNIGTSSQEEETDKIREGLINVAYSHDKKHLKPNYNNGLIGIHQINPAKVAYASQNILDDKTPEMGYLKWMYLTSQYVSGYPIKDIDEQFSKNNKSGESTYFGVLTIGEYRDVGKEVANYMNTNKKVPETIKVDGRTLHKGDLEFLFARLTYDHTDKKNMTFPKYIFVNRSYEPFDIISKYIRSLFNQITA